MVFLILSNLLHLKKHLDPDSQKMNADQQPWFRY